MMFEDLNQRLEELEEMGVLEATKEATDARIKFMIDHGVTAERLADSQKIFTLLHTMAARSLVSDRIRAMTKEDENEILRPLPGEVLNSFIEELPEDQREIAAVYAMLGMSTNIAFTSEVAIDRYLTMVDVLSRILEIPDDQAAHALTTHLMERLGVFEEGEEGVVVNTPLGKATLTPSGIEIEKKGHVGDGPIIVGVQEKGDE